VHAPRKTKAGLAPVNIANIGTEVDQIDVTIGPQFLNLFSEHLYSSPNKAFEELVSNSWDAGATVVYVHLTEDLHASNAAVWVLDNGESMDVQGLEKLWHVGTSTKRAADPPAGGRPQIGKFGIGKLATYILGHQLTYVCRAKDGKIRAVTMDYKRIDKAAAEGELHIDPLKLSVRELNRKALSDILKPLGVARTIMPLVEEGVPVPKKKKNRDNEFGHPDVAPTPLTGTWTLVIMTELKEAGQQMQIGWIRRMLRASLPLGPSMDIVFNGDPLMPLRSDVNIAKQWRFGPDLGLTEFTIEDDVGEEPEKIAVTARSLPFPSITVKGFSGAITGNVYLYEDKISGGKSEQMGPSNGFFVNVLGRVINAEDVDFGLANLSHSAWSKFRACIRADGLDAALAITREDIKKNSEVRIFKALLMALFNIARNEENRLSRASWPNAGQVLSDTWAAIPLEPLRKVISDRIGSTVGLPSFVRVDPKSNMEVVQREWEEVTQDRSGKIIENVAFESLGPDEPLAQYDLNQRSIVVNKNHPFTLEHCETREDQEFVRNVAVVDLLTDSYIADLGVDESQHSQIREYRDQILRLLAQLNRKSGATIAGMLAEARSSVKGLEKIVGDALRYLGFVVEPLGQPGQPEGIATAPLPPSPQRQHMRSSYSFTYDAKSTKHGKVSTGNVKVSGLARHRDDKTADFALVVGPDFTVARALLKECAANKITPMRSRDLATLVMLTAAVGSLDLDDLRRVFDLRNPDEVHEWVEKLKVMLEKQKLALSLDIFFRAVKSLDFDGPNAVSASVVAQKISDMTEKKTRPKVADVRAVVSGLMVLVPSLIRLTSKDDIQFSTSPEGLRSALVRQIKVVPEPFRFGYMKEIQ
jgi:hypothetical protein